MGIQAPAEVKFRLIQEAISQNNNVLSVSCLCRIAGVSRSGFYAWMEAAPVREKREDQDQCIAHCLPQTRPGARVAPQRCTILRFGKALSV